MITIKQFKDLEKKDFEQTRILIFNLI
jgi:hypothetical protein